MKKNKKKIIGWGIVILGFIVELYALISGITTNVYEVNYGLFAIMIFSYVAGTYIFGFNKMLVMNVISACSAFLFENMSVSFGFPFGYFNHFASGIRIGNIPLQVGLGYYFYAFSGWLFADLIIGDKNNDKLSKIARPLIGSFIASSMDLATDAINGLVMGSYEYPSGGGFFGSPLTNSFGWIITTFVTLIIWEYFIIPKKHKKVQSEDSLVGTPSIFHLQNCILLGMQILAPFIGFIIVKNKEVIDVLGNSWQVHYVYESSTIVALLILVFSMILGIFTWIRKREKIGE